MIRRIALALAALFSTTAANAETVALVGGTLVDGTLKAPVRDSVILVDGERITAVGTVATLPVPAGARVISTEGMTVLPGLWDMHVHLMLVGHSDYAHWDKTYLGRLRDTIMPAAAKQLLMAGVTGARDLGAPLDDSIAVRDAIAKGTIPGPTLFVSGPFLQHRPYPGTEAFRWGIEGVADARAKVRRLAAAKVDVIKLIDQDEMTDAEVEAVVDEAHKAKLPVVAHAHRPEEIRRGLRVGVDDFEHTGLATAAEYPADIMAALAERTARGAAGPLFWTPTISILANYPRWVDNHEFVDAVEWHEGLTPEIVADIRQSLAHPESLDYFRSVPQRQPTLARKFDQLRKSGAVMLIGTDSGVPMSFHSNSTWQEIDTWVRAYGVPAQEAIRAATWWPAVAMKAERDYGTVTPGKFADIIAVKGDVLAYPALLQRVDMVVKHGRRVK